MIVELEKFAVNANITFSTNEDVKKSKTKCMIFSSTRSLRSPKCMILNKRKLPWVESFNYLGTLITNEDEILNNDMKQKQSTYIANTYQLLQEFRWMGSRILNNIMKV